jgi:DNA-binding NtrC family response regulator
VVDDDEQLRRITVATLRRCAGRVDELRTGDAAVERILDSGVEPFDLILAELHLPGADGAQVLRAARERSPRTHVILMTTHGSIETAVELMRLGAADVLQKPFDPAQLELCVGRALAGTPTTGSDDLQRKESGGLLPASPVVAVSTSMHRVLEVVERVAPARSTVLITGETGTGKEVIAGLIHRLSPRARRPLVKVNCAALPEPLLESELFGHERGAFTGADRQRTGRFEQASGGTLFLDEVGEMSPSIQVKLLRVLQDQEFHRLGGTEPVRTDARIIAATNVDLEGAMRSGLFRRDLYFRLNVVEINLAPLRDRPEDAVAMATRFLEETAQRLGCPSAGLSEAARACVRGYSWPGNVRELRNAVERALLLADGSSIEPEHLSLPVEAGLGRSGDWSFELPADGVDLRIAERDLVLAALERAEYVQKDAAALLRVTPRKLNYMIRRMGVTHSSWRRNSRQKDTSGAELAPTDGDDGARRS